VKRTATHPTLLLTGFDPFDGAESNPSWDAACALDGRIVGGHRVVARQLPTEFDASLRALRKAIRETTPALVASIGLAGGRKGLSLERVAINVDDARIPDNAGAQPIDARIAARGPAAYFSTLPIKAMLAALQERGIPAHVSQTAGTYVCNHVFYGLMHALRRNPGVRGGFIHVPNAGRGGMPLDDIVEGLRIALRVAATTHTDARIAAGAED
jgi:pyroglutamyl-peptidase